jgi:phospholipase/carboxylesterase
MMDEACFYFHPERRAESEVKVFGDKMKQLSFDELTDQMMNLYRERKYADALQIVEQNADRFPEHLARTTFWKMCLLSLCGRSNDVISIFQKGLDVGLWWAESQFRDTDLDAVRDLPEFRHLAAISQEKYQAARMHIERDQTILLPEASVSDLYPLLIALHGGAGNKDSNLDYWKITCDKGWLVLSPQSTQPLFSGSYSWIEPEQALADLQFYVEQMLKDYPIDQQRVVIAGFSQGSGMAIYAALSGKLKVRGFIGIGTYWADPESLTPLAQLARQTKSIRGYFVVGEKDQTLNKTREIQKVLNENNIQFGEEVYPDLGHEFPPDFDTAFDKAIKFILE